MKKITLLVLFLSTFWGYSQVKNYTFTQTTSAYTEITGTALGDETSDAQSFVDQTVPLGGATLTGPGIPIGFTFTFNGYVYDRFAVSTDGWISLGSSAFAPNAVNCTVTDATAPLSSTSTVPSAELSAKIAGLAKNLQAQSGSTLTFATIGTAPNRVLVVQWKKYRRSGITGDDFNFQIRLNETSNTVSIAYGSFVNAPSASTYAYQVGMRAEPTAVASNFVNRKSTTTWNATVAGTAAADNVLMSDVIAPSSGLNFTWTPPTCGSAKVLAASAITANSATLNLGAYTPTPASYEYIVSTSATLPLATASGTATTDPTAAVSGLNANTSYYVFIRTKCGADFTPWITGTTFKTPCSDVTTYFEDFDTYAAYILPNCWDKGASTSTIWISPGSVSPLTSPNYLSMFGGAGTVTYAIMPPVSNLQAGTHRLRFNAFSLNSVNALEVGYFSPADGSTFVLIQKVNLPATAQTFIVTPGVLPAGVKNLVFRNNGTLIGGYSINIDDVMYEPIPACTDIPATVVKEVTDTSVNFSWTKGGSETEWQYAYGPSTVLNPNSLTPVTYSGAATAVTVSGLSPSTKYRLWIRSKCSATDFGAWKGSAVFTTTCVPTTQFVENFDANTILPACWTKMGTTGNITTGAVAGTSTAPNALTLYAGSATSPVFVTLPSLSDTGAGTYQLRFKAKGGTTGCKLDVGYFTDMTDPSSFVYLQTVAIGSTTSFDGYLVGLGSDPKSPNLAFRNAGAPSGNIYIDDVTWEPVPSCLTILGLASTSVASTTASFGWTAGGNENAWQYVIGGSTVTDPFSLTPVNVSTNVANVTGLMPSTSYKIWVRSKCSDTNFGSWMWPVNFKTSCSSITDFAQNFDAGTTMPSCWGQVGSTGNVYVSSISGTPTSPNAMYLISGSATAPAILAMPPVSNAADKTHRLRFKVKASAINAKLELGYLLNFNDPSSFVPLYANLATQTDLFENKSVDVDFGGDPATDFLAFRNAGVPSATLYIDDIIWEKKPTCADASNIVVAATSGSTATVSWAANAAVPKWEYAFGATTVSDPSTLIPVEVSTPTASISSLTPVTTYRFWVRSKCSATDLGAWIGPLIITTSCASVTEFTQSFDASTSLPSCWNKVGVNGSIYPTSLADAPSKGNVLAVYGSSATTPAVAAMPPVSNISAKDHVLKFKYKATVVGTVLEVGFLPNLSDPSSFVMFASITGTTVETFQTQNVTIPANPLSNVLAFRSPATGTGSMYIDDVSWDFAPTAVPACATGVNAVPHTTCGNFATVIAWSAVSGADGYKLNVGTTPGGSDILNTQDVIGLSYSVVANRNTTYYYTVKPYNSLGTATGCSEKSYVTNVNGCNCISVPTSKDGYGITNVQLGASNFVNPAVTYSDFSTKPVSLAVSGNTNLKVSLTTGSVYKTLVWIDFNDNFIFEASELVFTGKSAAASPTVLDASFMMPATAVLGMHSMRIIAIRETYSIGADSCYNGASAVTLDFKVNLVTSVANDAPAAAVALTVGANFAANAITGTNVNSTGSVLDVAPVCGGYNGADVWYSAVVPASGNLTFEVNSVAGGLTNTAAAAYSGTPTALTVINCDDSSSTAGDNQPKIILTGRTVGEVIYFMVWENGGDAYGAFKVSAYDSTVPVLDIDSFDANNFSYYPNPVRDMLNLSFNQEISNVSVMNLLGQQVINNSLNASHGKIDMSGLSKGAYLVKVTVGNQSKTIKIVKE